jgi:glucose-1-phosphate thymidylyltransferase
MKALILAGGRGTRLRPITHTINKHLIPIGGEPMIVRVINDIVDLGIKDIIINLNKGDTEVPKELGDGSKFGVKFSYIEQPEPNGMMYPILLAKDLLGDEDFILHAGDNVLAGGLKKYRDEFEKSNSSAHLLVTKIKNPERFSVVLLDKDGFVEKTVEKPQEHISDLAVTAIYFYRKEIIKAMENVKPIIAGNSSKPEYYPPPAHQWLIDNGYKVTVSEVTGWWKDTGKPEDLIYANRMVLEGLSESIDGEIIESNISGTLKLGKGSKIINSTIRGPVIIGENCIIKNTYIGPFTSVSDGCEITNSEIENSIVMGSSRITDINKRIDSSIIGLNCSISSIDSKPNVTQFFVGENSTVKI